MDKKCDRCIYQGELFLYGWEKFCDYFGKTGELRKCECGEKCEKFKERT